MVRKKSFTIDAQKRNQSIIKYQIRLKRIGCTQLGDSSVNDFFYTQPLDEKAVLIVGLGTDVRGNMQYVLDELNQNEEYADFRIYVRTKEGVTEEKVNEFIQQNGWKRTKTVPKGYGRKLETCKYLLTESYFPYNWVKRPGQILIDIWHGTPLKCLGVLKNGNKCHLASIQQKNFLCSDYLLYPNIFTRDVMWRSYKITSLLGAKALMLGYPRTSGLLSKVISAEEEVRKTLAPNGEKIYAYMPTFRGYMSDKEALGREESLLNFLDQRLTDDQILYVNLHHHINGGLGYESFKHIKQFPKLIDSYEILAMSDALISDYSSVFFDYLATGKHIILYIEDYDTYKKYQGLNMDIKTLPFDLAEKKDDIIRFLNQGKIYDDTSFRAEMCANDGLENAKKLCKLFLGDESWANVEPIPKNHKRKTLLYSDACVAGPETDMLYGIVEGYDTDNNEIYVGIDENKTSQHKDSAYPLLHNALTIASRDETWLSKIGRELLEQYKNGNLSFKYVIEYLKHDYALMPIRMYGYTAFDSLVVFDTSNPEMVISLSLAQANHKAIYVSKAMFSEITAKNRFMKDALCFAAQYCDDIIVPNKEVESAIKQVLPFFSRSKVVVIDCKDAFLSKIDVR